MPRTSQKTTKKLSAAKAMAMLGVAATVAYTAPSVTQLGEAHASGGENGGFFGFGGGGSGGGGGPRPRGFGSGSGGFNVTDEITARECSDCHEAYGAEALTQGAWKRIMGDLGNHFGENAMLPENTRQHIENYLVSNAPPGDGPIRITEYGWFKSEHRGEVSRASMDRAKSWANCQACHGGGRR